MIAISTAFAQTLIAIDINGEKDFLTLPSECKQSENVLASIDGLLEKNNIKITDNTVFAIVLGPGSFTGLRIGASLVKGLCAGSSEPCKVIGLSSLQHIAYEYITSAKPKKPFMAVINALSGLCFVCEFSQTGEKLSEEKLITLDELKKTKLDKIGIKNEGLCKKEVELTPQVMLNYANLQFEKQNFVDVKSFAPIYLRKSQAEVGLEQKQKAATKKI